MAPEFNHLEASQLLQAWAKIEDRIEVTRGFHVLRAQQRAATRAARLAAGGPLAGSEGEGDEGEGGEERESDLEEEELGALEAGASGLESEDKEVGEAAELGPPLPAGRRARRLLRRDLDGWCITPAGDSSGGGASGDGEEGGGSSSSASSDEQEGEVGEETAQEPFASTFPEGTLPGTPNLFGKLVPGAAGVTYVSCYPGVAVMDTLIGRVYPQRALMTDQSLSQLVHSLACLRHKPPPEMMDGFLQRACCPPRRAALRCAMMRVLWVVCVRGGGVCVRACTAPAVRPCRRRRHSSVCMCVRHVQGCCARRSALPGLPPGCPFLALKLLPSPSALPPHAPPTCRACGVLAAVQLRERVVPGGCHRAAGLRQAGIHPAAVVHRRLHTGEVLGACCAQLCPAYPAR